MTHKDAPPISPEQERMETFYRNSLSKLGQTCGWSRDKIGVYHAEFARIAWAAWNAAQDPWTSN